jgi:hypothetical protein
MNEVGITTQADLCAAKRGNNRDFLGAARRSLPWESRQYAVRVTVE